MSDGLEIGELLAGARQGKREAMDQVFALVYEELRGVAHRKLRGYPEGSVGTTALVHEAYLKLAARPGLDLRDRAHFFALAARAMRHILVDFARRRQALKRGGDAKPAMLDEERIGEVHPTEILALEDGLSRLAEADPRLAQLVELRFFGGLSVEETAALLEVSARTVKRDWRKARAFLYREIAAS